MLTHYFCNGNIWQFIFYIASECLSCCIRFNSLKFERERCIWCHLAILAQWLIYSSGTIWQTVYYASRCFLKVAFLFGNFFFPFQCIKVLIMVFSDSAETVFEYLPALAGLRPPTLPLFLSGLISCIYGSIGGSRVGWTNAPANRFLLMVTSKMTGTYFIS